MATYTATFTRTATGTTPATVSLTSSLSALPSGVTAASSVSISAVDPIPDSQGSVFTFNGVSFVAKNIKVKAARPTIDVSVLSATGGTMRKLQAAPLKDSTTITCEYFGSTAPTIGSSGAVVCEALGVSSGNAFCEDFELTAAVGELIMGNLSLKLTG